jgi:pimeloyl-ACP methyl ester carboxylesterase
MIRYLVPLLAGALAAGAADPLMKPDPKSPVGLWEGPVKAGGLELRLAFEVKNDGQGKLTATMTSLDQGAEPIPCPEVTFADGKLTIGIPKLKVQFTSTLSADGTALKGELEQAGQKYPLELQRVEKFSTRNRPQHPKRPYPYADEDVTFENTQAKITLAGTLTLPKGPGPFPAVVLVTGSGPQDRDETLLGHKPFLVLADHLTRHGIAVLRFDDRGVGKSGGKHEGATSADFATDARAAVTYLKGRKEIDPKRIGIAGHSEGGLIAPMVAAEHPGDVAFLVLLAGPGLPGDEVLRTQLRAVLKAADEKTEAAELAVRLQATVLPVAKQPGPAAERKKKVTKAATDFFDGLTKDQQKQLGGDREAVAAGLSRLGDDWMHYFLTYDPRPALGKVTCPVLAVAGELDVQVSADTNLAAIERAMKAGGNERVTTKVFPKLNHLFQHAKTGSPGEYGQIEETFAPEVLTFVTEWIGKLK